MKNKSLYSRRDFTKLTTLGAIGSIPLINTANTILTPTILVPNDLKIFVFSKHLQFLNYMDMAEAAKEIGFDGIDLTVRDKGHVSPEKVLEDLPKATEAIKAFGFTPDMITTKIKDIDNPLHIKILETASQLHYTYCRMGWLKYSENNKILKDLNEFKNKITDLSKLTHSLGIIGTYQNHAGIYMGSSIWDLDQVLEGINPNHLGAQYDITHATVEGGRNWEVGFRLIQDHINSLVIKDFKWGISNGKWKPIYTPLGEGMVDFNSYLFLLKKLNINVPISLHYEYDLGGAEHGGTTLSISHKEVFARMKKDVIFLREAWKNIE
ncbi:sugar phosphate isomerase/epimerase [Aquimarina addita]|uniref:Sugar phosphate isomerase/epimerase n=1 Tax=Aquimarina addita TaxID=870485 RepID=A0ABP7XA86_9FLAO